MATITDLPYELLYHIIFLLVQSSAGAADFARIISVCRIFLLIAEDELILKIVNFDKRINFKNIYQYQHVNSLLVKCSEAGNVAAQFLLGKVILVSSSQLLIRKWQKTKYGHPCDHLKLGDLGCIFATNVHAQNCRVDSFMAYFSFRGVSTSGSSQTRLVHYQLVKLVLLHGNHHDLIEMSTFLKIYSLQFTRIEVENNVLFNSITTLLTLLDLIRYFEYISADSILVILGDLIAQHREQTIQWFEIYLE